MVEHRNDTKSRMIVYNNSSAVECSLLKGGRALKRITRKPSKATLDRMQRKAEIQEIRSRAFINYCEGLSKITPLIRWVVGGIVTFALTLFL